MSLKWRYPSANQRAGYLSGAAFALVGTVGLLGGDGLLGAASLGPFRMNGAQAFVHLGAAAILVLGAAVGPGAARGGNGIAGSAAAGLAVLGLGSVGPVAEMLALSVADAALVAPVGLLLLAVAASPAVARRKDGLVRPGVIAARRVLPDEHDHGLEPRAAVPLERSGREPRASHEGTGTLVAFEPPTGSELCELSKKELYEMAQELDIAGRSKMRKRELARAVASALRGGRRTAA